MMFLPKQIKIRLVLINQDERDAPSTLSSRPSKGFCKKTLDLCLRHGRLKSKSNSTFGKLLNKAAGLFLVVLMWLLPVSLQFK